MFSGHPTLKPLLVYCGTIIGCRDWQIVQLQHVWLRQLPGELGQIEHVARSIWNQWGLKGLQQTTSFSEAT